MNFMMLDIQIFFSINLAIFNFLSKKFGKFFFKTGADVVHAGVATHFCDSAKMAELEKALLNIKNTNQIENVLNDFCFKPKSKFSLTKYLPQINKHFSASSVEGILYSLEQDDSEWAKHTIKVFHGSTK